MWLITYAWASLFYGTKCSLACTFRNGKLFLFGTVECNQYSYMQLLSYVSIVNDSIHSYILCMQILIK